MSRQTPVRRASKSRRDRHFMGVTTGTTTTVERTVNIEASVITDGR